jgi:hypothetical protein
MVYIVLQDRLNIPRNGIFYVARTNDPRPVDAMVLAFLRVITMKTKEELAKWSDGVSSSYRSQTSFYNHFFHESKILPWLVLSINLGLSNHFGNQRRYI